MTYKNPFPYSSDNKRYHTWNYYLRKQYQSKVCKVALNAGLSCPNRDGTCGHGGCSFCGTLGSGENAGDLNEDLLTQFRKGLLVQQRKWPNSKAIAYFQAYTNTYCNIAHLKEMIQPFLNKEDVVAISIATRADCLEDDKIAYLQSLTKQKDIWIELGLQTIHNSTAQRINRGHTYETFLNCINRLEHTDLKLCVHLINSLPYETKEDMIATAKEVGKLPIHAVKIHMLHIMKNTKMAQEYEEDPFPILSKEEFVDVTISQLEVIPENIIIQRLTGDSVQDVLLVPEWTKHKIDVLNAIDLKQAQKNSWQGKYLHANT